MSVNSSGETTIPIGDWTTGSLKVHTEAQIAALKELTDQRFEDNNKALDAALIAAEKAVNAALTAAKEAVDRANAANEKRFESVNEFRKTLSDQTNSFLPRVEYQAHHNALVDRVTEMNDRINRSEGQTSGSQVTTSKLYAAIAAVGTVLGILVLVANGIL